MDELAKMMKVIKLKDAYYGQYLTASEDGESVTLSNRDSERWKPKNTEWRIQWLKGPRASVGQVLLWSIYDKVLTVDGDPSHYIFSRDIIPVSQRSWPEAGDDAQWKFDLTKSKNNHPSLSGNLLKRSKFSSVMGDLALTVPPLKACLAQERYILSFELYFRKSVLRWLNDNHWKVEVVSSPWESTRAHNPNNILVNNSGSLEEGKGNYKDKEAYHLVTLPKTLDVKDIAPIHKGGQGKFVNPLSIRQAGQVYINMAQSPFGVQASAGYSYYNSGSNVNGSGIQKNGDVSVSNEFGRGRDNNAKFVNY